MSTAAAISAEAGTRHNLPSRLTSFVGREREIAEVAALVGAHRLVTLVGAPGVGKTRLSLEVARSALGMFPDGVWLVELAPLIDAAHIPSAVATALAVHEQPGQPLTATLVEQLRSRRLLFLLDNCEHLVGAAAALAEMLLRTCPGVHVLATSREPLAIEGEETWRVPSLTLPTAEQMRRARQEGLAALDESEAIRLFVVRARAAARSFELTDRNVSAVVEICTCLDGIPLALELAVVRVRALSVQEIAARLDERFRLLTGGSRLALPRHQTLRGTVEWSYELLTQPEQALLRRLAVFAGGWTLEAAEGVCAGEGLASEEILDTLVSLVDKSLVQAEQDEAGETRYRLLETIREYGLERLASSSELGIIQHRHAAYYLEFAAEAGRQIQGADQVRMLDRLDRDHDNLLAALGRAIDRGDVELAMHMVASLGYFWYYRGHYSEAQELQAAVLELPAGPDLDGLRAEILEGAGVLTRRLDLDTARAFLDEGLTIARRVGDRSLLIQTLATLGLIACGQVDYVTARAALEEGLKLARAAGDTFNAGRATHVLGLVALEADRDLDAAWSSYEASLALFRQLGNPRMIGVVRLAMGRVAWARGDLEAARAHVAESLSLLVQVGDIGMVPSRLHVLAAIDADAGRLEQAVRLAGAASAMDDAMGIRIAPVARREYEAWLVEARSSLDDGAFTRLWAEGRAMARDQACALAIGPASTPPADAGSAVVADRRHDGESGRLTRREREVAALVADGLSNRRIADRLGLSDRTIDAHLRNIMGKLELASRAQVAAWSVRRRLAESATGDSAGEPERAGREN